MAWLYLFIAAALECVWPISLKESEGFTKLGPSCITVVATVVSLVFLSFAMRSIPVGTAYAVWTGIGSTGVAILGILLYSDPRDFGRLACIGLIIIGVLGLRLFSPDSVA